MSDTQPVITIQSLEEDVCCDNNHAFKAKNVLLIPFNSSSKTSLGEVMFVDCDFKIVSATGSTINSGYLMACPVCNLIHLSGFNNPTEGAVQVDGKDNTILARNLDPEL